jgi:hypothetical protein
MSNTALIVTIGGTTAAVDFEDYYTVYPLGTVSLSSCRMCGALTVAPGTHLDYHIAKGDYLTVTRSTTTKDGEGQ